MARLRIIVGDQEGQALVLRPPGPYVIGRAPGCQFQILDRHVSRHHFSISFRSEGYVLSDLQSSGGTFVNGARAERVLLSGGDQVRAGSSTLALELEPTDDLVGRHLGAYHVLERVGSGGMGTVYRARQVRLRRIVALKVLAPRFAADREFSALFIEEARAAAELSHPHVLRVYDVNRLDGVLFYAMEFAAKGSVEDLIRRQVRLSIHRALDLARQTTLGLEFAERVGIVHRDIKPANLMIGEHEELKIGDLGVASRSGERAGRPLLPESASDASPAAPSPGAPSPATPSPVAAAGAGSSRARGISGSPPYMPPEQVLGRSMDHRGDLYALGASLYEMLTGVVPFRGETVKDVLLSHLREPPPDPRVHRREIPEELARLVQTLMAKAPEERPPSAPEARERLERLLDSTPAESRRRRRSLRDRVPRAAFYVLALVLAAAVGFLVTWSLF